MTAVLLVTAALALVWAGLASRAAFAANRRARGPFVLGFCCGVVAGGFLRRRLRRKARSVLWRPVVGVLTTR